MDQRKNLEVMLESALTVLLVLFEIIVCLSVVVCAFVRILLVGLFCYQPRI